MREQMIRQDLSPKVINKHAGRIWRMFKWASGAASEELVPVSVHLELSSVDDLKKGRTPLRKTPGVGPVDIGVVQKTLPKMLKIPADMVRVQLLTGARPQDVCNLRPCDVDRTGDVWIYRPQTHKTEHENRERVIFIGSEAQTVLRPYMLRSPEKYCFSPAEAVEQQRREKHVARQTPLGYGNGPGTNRRSRPKRKARERYSTDSYRRAIYRACDRMFPPPEDINKSTEQLQQQTELHGISFPKLIRVNDPSKLYLIAKP